MYEEKPLYLKVDKATKFMKVLVDKDLFYIMIGYHDDQSILIMQHEAKQIDCQKENQFVNWF